MKKLKVLVVASAMMMIMATTAYAATATFSGILPAYQGDTEVSTVARAHDSTSYKYFTITITSLGTGYDSVRAWTENTLGGNLSDPFKQVSKNVQTNVYYTTVPSMGTNVVLNLDNPVYTSESVSVGGTWTPN